MQLKFNLCVFLMCAVSLSCASEMSQVNEATTVVSSVATLISIPSTSENPTSVPPPMVSSTTQVNDDQLVVPAGICDFMTEGSMGFGNLSPNKPDSVVVVGKSDGNLPIIAEHWGRTSGPQVLVVGQVHGDECAPAFVVNELRERPPENYGLWLIPTLNPDGHFLGTRTNGSAVDLNRDGLTQSAPETKALMAFTRLVAPDLTVYLHSPLNWIGYFNGSLAQRVGSQLVSALGMDVLYTSGTNPPESAFLWQGQDAVMPGQQSILIEMPSISTKEAPASPNRSPESFGTVGKVSVFASIVRDTLDEAMKELE
jgi:hypothetical protein